MPFVVPLQDTPQPVPTGGALSIIARANSTTPYASGGGGGGGASTISTFATASVSSLSVSSINGAVPGGVISTFNIASISSLSVSSINGAAPGGSVPANLELSTLTMGIPGVITGVSSLVGGGGILSVGDQLAVSSISGLGNALLLDGAGYAINVAGSAVNIGAAPVNISTATISSINGLVPGAVSDPLSVSSLSVSSVNGGAPPSVSYSGLYATYNQGGKACSLGTTYFSLVNGIGQLVMTMPETSGANWAGGTKFIIFGPNFGGGTQGMPNTWNIDNVFISCPDGTGAYNLNSWSVASGGAQLNINTALGGSPSTFAITAQVRY